MKYAYVMIAANNRQVIGNYDGSRWRFIIRRFPDRPLIVTAKVIELEELGYVIIARRGSLASVILSRPGIDMLKSLKILSEKRIQ